MTEAIEYGVQEQFGKRNILGLYHSTAQKGHISELIRTLEWAWNAIGGALWIWVGNPWRR